MTASGKSRKREQAVAFLLVESTIEGAAIRAGIAKRTLLRWLKEPSFQALYQNAKNELLRAATTKLRAKAGEAVNTLASVAGDTDAPSGARVMAAVQIVRLSLDAEAQETLEARIRALEQQAESDEN